MKTIILSIVFLSIMVSMKCQPVHFDDVFDSVAHDLGFDTGNVQISVRDAYFTRTIKFDDEPAAATVKLRREFYRIDIYFSLGHDRLIRALIHEFIHVSQMRSGRLVVNKHSIVYDNVIYTDDMPYLDRQFEIDAIQMADELFNKYFK